jgi:hypothetical protein
MGITLQDIVFHDNNDWVMSTLYIFDFQGQAKSAVEGISKFGKHCRVAIFRLHVCGTVEEPL